MKKHILLILLYITAASIASASDRESAIEQKLTCFSTNPAVTWNDLCSTVNNRTIEIEHTLDQVESGVYKTPASVKATQAKAMSPATNGKKNQEAKAADYQVVPPTAAGRVKRAELAVQFASLLYETDASWPLLYSQTYDESNKVEKEAELKGLYGSYTWTIGAGRSRSFAEALRSGILPHFVKVEGDISEGETSYESHATGKMNGFDAWEGNFRILAGYTIGDPESSLSFSPYTGLGYRQYTDKAGAWEDYWTETWSPFTMRYSYYYLPLGMEVTNRISSDWDLKLKFEGDLVVFGSTHFAMSEIEGTFSRLDVQANEIVDVLPRNARSTLKGGYGLKTSAKLIKKFSAFNIFAEPYLDYWSIKASKPEQAHAQGTNGRDYVSVSGPNNEAYKPIYEPANTTVECGLRMGLQF